MPRVKKRILGIVVTYFPTRDALSLLLDAAAPQLDALLLIDNTPYDQEGAQSVLRTLAMPPNVRIQSIGRNIGIAAAQDIGIRNALEGNYDYVFLSDQDSIPASDMVWSLQACAEDLKAKGIEIGCICPAYFDSISGRVFSFQVQEPTHFFYSTISAELADPWLEVVTAISSGSLIPTSALRRIGGMREEFFIDHVDTEWCHRARAAGLHNFGTARARMNHQLGDAPFKAWYFGWREHSEYSPPRLYYRFRNFMLLCKLPHVPLRWSIRAGWYWLGNAYAHVLFARHPLANLQAIMKGLWDGIRGRSGPVDKIAQ